MTRKTDEDFGQKLNIRLTCAVFEIFTKIGDRHIRNFRDVFNQYFFIVIGQSELINFINFSRFVAVIGIQKILAAQVSELIRMCNFVQYLKQKGYATYPFFLVNQLSE